MRRASIPWLLVVVAVTDRRVRSSDDRCCRQFLARPRLARFEIADDLRAPWLDAAAKLITKLGLIAIVGSAVLVGAPALIKHRNRAGAALALTSVWITKSVVDRPRPPDPLVHTSGQSYPSAHAANSIGWIAFAIALTVVIQTGAGRIAAITADALLAVLVGLSRIYLRAHYACDVLAGDALAMATYALATIGAVVWESRRDSAIGGQATPSRMPGVT